MKWVFYLIVFIYMCYRAVYGVQVLEPNAISVDQVTYGEEGYLPVGARKVLACKGSSKHQKLEWLDPSDNEIRRLPRNRLHVQEHLIQDGKRGTVPALFLTISEATVEDTGFYKCRSEDNVMSVELCVIEPSKFVNTPLEVTVDLGRSITLTCQAKGTPEPRLQWTRNGLIVTDDGNSTKYRVMTKYNSQDFEGLLTIMHLKAEDSGIYSCESIQESPSLEFCSTSQALNITLHVSYGPIFENGNDTKFVHGKNSQEVGLACSASAFPEPEYRWFRDLGDSLYEYDQKRITVSKDENEAVLLVTASPATFGQRYICKAINDRGVAEKSFVLLKLEKPWTPSEVTLYDSTMSTIQLNVTWNEGMVYPIDGFEVQYLIVFENSRKSGPEWKRGKLFFIELNEDEQNPEVGGLSKLVTIPDLEEETEYWLRLRATNGAGESPWSEAITVSTAAKLEETDSTEQTTSNSEPDFPNATFYGIFFGVGILVVAVVCMFAMRLV